MGWNLTCQCSHLALWHRRQKIKGKWVRTTCYGMRGSDTLTPEQSRQALAIPRCECPGFVKAERVVTTGSPAAVQAAQIAHDLYMARWNAATYLRGYKLSQKLGGCPHGQVSKRQCKACRRERERSPKYRKAAAARMRKYRQKLTAKKREAQS